MTWWWLSLSWWWFDQGTMTKRALWLLLLIIIMTIMEMVIWSRDNDHIAIGDDNGKGEQQSHTNMRAQGLPENSLVAELVSPFNVHPIHMSFEILNGWLQIAKTWYCCCCIFINHNEMLSWKENFQSTDSVLTIWDNISYQPTGWSNTTKWHRNSFFLAINMMTIRGRCKLKK